MSDWKLKIDIEQPNVNQASQALRKLFKEMDRLEKKTSRVDKKMRKLGGNAGQGSKKRKGGGQKVGGGGAGLGSGLSAGLGIGAGAGAAIAILASLRTAILSVGSASKRAAEEAADFQNAIVSISRISGIAQEDVAAMSQEFLQLSTQIPVGARAFQEFAEVASRFGIKGTEGVKQFAKSFGLLQSIIGNVSEETVKSVARIASITKFDTGGIDRLINSVVVLGKNFATSEDQIIRTAERVAGDISEFGASAKEVLGLSTAFDALGIKSELGGSALVRILGAIQDKALTVSKDFNRLVDASGKTADEFRNLSLNSPVEALQLLVTSGESGAKIMDRLGLSGVRVQGVLGRLTNNVDTFSRAMSISSSEIETNNTLLEDAARQADTTAGKMDRLSNSVSAAFIGVGTSGEDAFGEFLSDAILAVEAFSGLNEEAVMLNPNIASLGNAFDELFVNGIEGITSLVESAEKMAPIFETVVDVISTLVDKFGKMIDLSARAFDFLDDDIFDPKSWDKLFGNIEKAKVTMRDAVGELELEDDGLVLIDYDFEFDGATFKDHLLSGFLETDKTNAELKKLDEIEKRIDAFNKKSSDIKFEAGLKAQGLDEIDKRIARLSRQFEKDAEALQLNTPSGKVALAELADSFEKTINNLTISGLVDDIKEIDKTISDLNKEDADLVDKLRDINKAVPQVAAITDVVAAGQFVSDSRESEKRSQQEIKKIELLQDIADFNRRIAEANKKRAQAKIVKIGGAS